MKNYFITVEEAKNVIDEYIMTAKNALQAYAYHKYTDGAKFRSIKRLTEKRAARLIRSGEFVTVEAPKNFKIKTGRTA